MALLVDGDAFCKLGVSGMLADAAEILGVKISDCARPPALPYMLRRGALVRAYGAEACAALRPDALEMESAPAPDATWLDKLASVDGIDPGEAILFAAAAQHGAHVLTGDKRAVIALKGVPGYPAALSGRIVVFEAMLLALCARLGHVEVRRRLGSLTATDKTLIVCFSAANPDPREALVSYYSSLAADVQPLILWDPGPGETT